MLNVHTATQGTLEVWEERCAQTGEGMQAVQDHNPETITTSELEQIDFQRSVVTRPFSAVLHLQVSGLHPLIRCRFTRRCFIELANQDLRIERCHNIVSRLHLYA